MKFVDRRVDGEEDDSVCPLRVLFCLLLNIANEYLSKLTIVNMIM